MYLMDCISHLGTRIRAKYQARPDPVMDAYTSLADKLVGTPRFLLDSDTTRTCVELNLGRPKVTLDALAHLVIPYPRLWVEWDDADRQKLRDKFTQQLAFAELRPMPGKVGFLLEAEPGGRAGTAIWAWTTPTGADPDIPNIGAIQPYFDLDQRFVLPPRRVEGLLKGNLAGLWHDNPVQLEALFEIWRTCEHLPSEWGERHYFPAVGNGALARELAYGDVVGEYIMIWAVLLMLTASRKTVELRPVDRTKLNKARAKRREIPLLDHTNVVMHVDLHLRQGEIRQPLSYKRKSPRVHLVSSYLARRGNRHWIVQPYMRGAGDTIHRVTQVRR